MPDEIQNPLPGHHLQRAPAEWPRFDLLTRDREFVIRTAIPMMNPLPEALRWGERIFFKRPKNLAGTIDSNMPEAELIEYVEGLCFYPQHFGENQ